MFVNSTLWSVNSHLTKISIIGASRYQIIKLKCTKFTFCWGSAPDPVGGAYSAPRPLALFKGLTSKEMEGNGRGGRKGKGEGRGEVDGGIWPTQKFWCGAPYAGKVWSVYSQSDNLLQSLWPFELNSHQPPSWV